MITPLMEESYVVDKGIRIRAELLESDEREKKWRASLVELDRDLGDYERPTKVGWNPPKRKVEFRRLMSAFIP